MKEQIQERRDAHHIKLTKQERTALKSTDHSGIKKFFGTNYNYQKTYTGRLR